MLQDISLMRKQVVNICYTFYYIILYFCLIFSLSLFKSAYIHILMHFFYLVQGFIYPE